MMAKIQETLQKTGLPCAYSHFRKKQAPPFLVYMGQGQYTLSADNTFHYKENLFRVEYYYTKKDELIEEAIENILLEDGFLYEKSDDEYIDNEDIFVIYYYCRT